MEKKRLSFSFNSNDNREFSKNTKKQNASKKWHHYTFNISSSGYSMWYWGEELIYGDQKINI